MTIIDLEQQRLVRLKAEKPDAGKLPGTQRIWECGCGSADFWLLEGGAIACRSCEKPSHFRWFDPAGRIA